MVIKRLPYLSAVAFEVSGAVYVAFLEVGEKIGDCGYIEILHT
jgi:hypothetical protein